MSVLLILILVVGIIVGILLPTTSRSTPIKYAQTDSKLDDVDDMVLYGEVTKDPFYNIMGE